MANYPIVINLHISDNFRIFVTEKEIVIRIFTIKTPRRWAKRQRDMKYTATIVLEYSDGSDMTCDVTIEGEEHDIVASLLMITRGTLMASIACKATCYKPDGTILCVYTK